MLTKSALVIRDADVLKAVNERSRAIVSFSFSSVDERTSAIVKPGASSPGERLDAIRFFKGQGIACGMFLLPVIPRVTDSPQMLEQAVAGPLSAVKGQLRELAGVDESAERVVLEVLETGRSSDHERLLAGL